MIKNRNTTFTLLLVFLWASAAQAGEGWKFKDLRQTMSPDGGFRLQVERDVGVGVNFFTPGPVQTKAYTYVGTGWYWAHFPHYGFYVYHHSIDIVVSTPNGQGDSVRGLVMENPDIVNSSQWSTQAIISPTMHILQLP